MQPRLQTALCQVKTSAAVIALAFGQGMAVGWASPAIEKFENNETPFAITEEERSWIIAIFDLGMALGSWISALFFTKAGRRYAIMVGPTTMLMWILLTFFATTPAFLVVARLLGGCGTGIVMTFSYLYIGEVASAHLRGKLVLTTTMIVPAGQLCAYLYGPYVSYHWQAIAPLPVAILIYVFIFFWMEETPFYLATVGRHDEMLEVLRRLRRGVPDVDIKSEAEAICGAVTQQLLEATSWRQAFAPPGVTYGCFLVLVTAGCFALAGVTSVLAYTTQIFSATGAPIDSNVSSMLVIAVSVVMVAIAMFAIENFGRRLQLCLGSIGNACAMGGMCIFMVVKEINKVDTSDVSWIPLFLMILYIASTGFGVNTVPWVLMSELLSQTVKAFLAPVVMTIISLTSFGCTKYFLTIGENSDYYACFGFFAAVNLFLSIFTLIFVPETKGKTLIEVQEMLRNCRFGSFKQEQKVNGVKPGMNGFSSVH